MKTKVRIACIIFYLLPSYEAADAQATGWLAKKLIDEINAGVDKPIMLPGAAGSSMITDIRIVTSASRILPAVSKFSDNSMAESNHSMTDSLINSEEEKNDTCMQAKEDAGKYYRKYKSAGNGAFLSGCLVVPGIFVATICYCTSPKYDNLGFPNAGLMKSPEYRDCYLQQAKKKKRQKVLLNFGIGLSVTIAAGILFELILDSSDAELP